MRFVSLFAGIGGIDLGLERAGMECVAQVENDPWCVRVLEKHWPDVPRFGDIRTLDPADLPDCDLIAGGFPCQPVSAAGRRKGQDDDRWLWPEFHRIVRVVRPRYVLVENVPGLLSRGMGDVLGDLAEVGYDTEWARIGASDVGAPHRRWRIFIVGYPNSDGREATDGRRFVSDEKRHCASQVREQVEQSRSSDTSDVAYPEVEPVRSGLREGQPAEIWRRRPGDGSGPPRITICEGCGEDFCEWHRRHRADCGCSDPWDESDDPDFGWWAADPADDPESGVGRVADGIPGRVDRLRGLGNAVVPQVAEHVGRMIVENACLTF
jgi:DNA (cytosine-5)-methyltransferase 1